MSSRPRVRAVGDRAGIIDLDHLDRVMSVASQLRELALPGVIEIVPAASTVLVTAVDRAAVQRVVEAMERIDAARPVAVGDGRAIVIDVSYDGEDLDEVAALTSLSRDAVIRAHTETQWLGAFGGFAPGFVYLAGADGRLDVPRRATPRTRVPAGSVALAGVFSAVYPGDSPGGWQLIGRTEQLMWDQRADPPALIGPGDRVRFRAVRESVEMAVEPVASAVDDRDLSREQMREPAAVIEGVGMQVLVQDGGRAGHASLGVTDSGALDSGALRLANALVGNPADAAGLEVLNGGLRLRAERELTVAVSGAEVPLTIEAADGTEAAEALERAPQMDAAFVLRAGERLELGSASSGMRAYLAVRGGIAGTSMLGSVAYDSLAKLGTAPLRPGDPLHLADAPANADPRPRIPARATGGHATLRAVAGPRDDWFSAAAIASFVRQDWRVTAESNRIGIRLHGAALSRLDLGELPSEGVVSGSIQVPPSGQPVLFLADHPVTGGYPVIATVIDEDLDRAAQLRPGDTLNFVLVDADDVGEPRVAEPREPAERAVRFSIEIDGRRHSVTVAREVAAALERLAAVGNEAELVEVLTALAAAAR